MGIDTAGAIWSGATQTWNIQLWEHWDKAALMKRRGEIGSRSFARGFRQEVMEDEGRTFPSVLRCAVADLNPLELLGDDWLVFTGADISSSRRPGNALATIAQRPSDKKRLVVDVRAKTLTSPQMWREMEDVDRLYHSNIFMVENNATQEAIMEWGLELNATLPVTGFMTGKNKSDPLMGLPGLEVEFENEGWIIPRPTHGLDCKCAWCRLWMELLGHPLAESTDLVMALWFAREAARTGSRPKPASAQKEFTTAEYREGRRKAHSEYRGRGQRKSRRR